MSKHTPGLWAWYNNPHGGAVVYASGGAGIADVLSRSGVASPVQETCEANARLIAASPDLYDAAVELLSTEPYLSSPAFDSAREKLRAAVAKASGRC